MKKLLQIGYLSVYWGREAGAETSGAAKIEQAEAVEELPAEEEPKAAESPKTRGGSHRGGRPHALTPAEKDEIRVIKQKTKMSNEELANKYNVCTKTIANALKG